MKRSLLSALIPLMAVTVWADEGVGTAGEVVPSATVQRLSQELSPKLLYQFLLAEIAGGRGEVSLAQRIYSDLAHSTQDARVARRATEIALFARNYEAALDAAKLWADRDPDSSQAQQMLTALLSVTNRNDELAAQISDQLAKAGPALGSVLLQLNQIGRASCRERV